MFEVHGAADFLAAVLMGMAIVAGAAFVLIQTVEAAIEATNQTSKWLGRQLRYTRLAIQDRSRERTPRTATGGPLRDDVG